MKDTPCPFAAFTEILRSLKKIESAIESMAEEKSPEDCFLSSFEVCERLKFSRRTLARLTGSGELPAIKAGRKLLFKSSDIEAFLESRYL